jgi:HEPN domain-containing protein
LVDAGAYADVVRESQDVVELVLKGALRFVGVDPPKRHDVHHTLIRFIARFPAAWAATLAQAGETLSSLAQQRGPAFYGDEEGAVPASELFGEDDAHRAVAVVDRLIELYGGLLGE